MRHKLQKLLFWMPAFEREAAQWFESEADRAAARRYVAFAVARHWRYWVWCALLIGTALIVFPFGGRFLAGVFGKHLALHRWLMELLVFVLYIAAALVSYSWLIGGAQRRLLWKHARECGVPVCLGCGYDLRGAAGARCSECGRLFEPGFSTRQHKRV